MSHLYVNSYTVCRVFDTRNVIPFPSATVGSLTLQAYIIAYASIKQCTQMKPDYLFLT